jgi:hypothetical protein
MCGHHEDWEKEKKQVDVTIALLSFRLEHGMINSYKLLIPTITGATAAQKI